MFPDGAINRDLTVLALPLAAGARGVALLTMIGGLSAATGMVVLDSLALAITISNDLAMPLLLRRPVPQEPGAEGDIGALVLWVRRLAILGVLALGFVYERLAGEAALVSIGLLSFAAVAQIAPAFLGGLFWRRGTARGAIAGMTAGSLAWVYLLLLPSIEPQQAITAYLAHGPLAIAWLSPAALVAFAPNALVGGVVLSLARQYRRLRRLFAHPPAERARAHAGERLRRRRRQAAGLPPVALVDHRGRTRSGGRALSRSGAGAPRLFGLHARERARLRPGAGGERATHPPCGIPAVARHRRLDLAPGAVAAACGRGPSPASRRSS